MSDNGVVTAPEGTAAEVAEAFAAPSPEDSRSRTLVWQDPVPTAAAGATMTGMEYMTAVVTGEVPPPPIAVTMRLRPVELEEGRVVFEGEPGEEHYNPIGVVHGGYAATLLDSALGCAVHTTLPAGVGYTSLGLEAKYVRPITRDTGRVLCEANVLYRGRKQATAEANLTAADSGKLLAHGIATCMMLGGERLGGAVAGELDQEPHAEAVGAVADVLAADVPGGAGDVEVRPGRLADELLEEGGGGDRPRLALLAEVGEVGDRPLHQLLVLGVQRQPPGQLAGLPRRRRSPRRRARRRWRSRAA